jgi:class 3 adenylate cyclase
VAVAERALCPVLVLREEELTLLEDALLSAARGDGRVVVLAGDAGMGKTRLATELGERARKIGASVLWGGCSEADLALPYLPFVEAIGNWLATADAGVITQALGPSAGELAQLFPQLGAAQPQSADPSQAKLRLYEAVLALLRIAAVDKGLLIVVEDLHWADPSTRELLDYMTRRMRGARVMVLATYRLDEMHRKHPLLPILQGWRRSRLADIVELTPLPADGVAQMIAAIFDYKEVSPEFRDFILERTEGNPFVLEEMLKEAIDRGDIYRTDTRWERKEIEELGIPRSVADSILLRVERLDPDHAEILRTAAVVGLSFDYQILLTVTGETDAIVQAALQACILQQLVVEEGPQRYRFRHALTREAIYEDLIGPRRQELHARTADALLRAPNMAPVDLARHLLAAQRWAEAVPACLAAAREAMERRAFYEAADLAERALAHIDDELERARTLGFIGEAMFNAAELARADGVLERAIEVLERRGLDTEAAPLHLHLGRVRWLLSRPEEAAAHYERARVVLEDVGPSRDLAVAYVRLAGLAMFNFNGEACVRHATRAIEVAEAAGDDYARVWAYLFLGGGLMPDVENVFTWMQRAVDESLARGFPDVAMNAVHNMTVMLGDAGFLDRADSLLERYDEIPPQPFHEFSRAFNRAILALLRGRARDAARRLDEVWRFVTEGNWPAWVGWTRQWLAYALVHDDRLSEAKKTLREPTAAEELQELNQDLHSGLAYALAAGDTERSMSLVRMMLEHADVFSSFGYLVLLATEALARAGAVGQAATFFELTRAGEDMPMQAGIVAAKGLVALHEKRYEDAAELLRAAAERFESADYILFAWRVRRALAETLHATGRVDEARNELQRCVEGATERGAALDRRLALELATSLGLDLATVAEPAAPRSPETMETSERIATVMFADVRGYTSMTRASAPADMHDRMTTFYRWARNEIEKNDGMVDRYAGDAVMASWNTTVSSLDHTALAVETAIAIQDKANLMDLPVGVGIAVGPAFVGRMTGSDNVDVIGETTNLAARLQAQAAGGEIALSEDGYRRALPVIERRGLSVSKRVVELKGYDRPVTAFILSRGS